MCPESWKSKGDGKRPGPAGLSETVQPKQLALLLFSHDRAYDLRDCYGEQSSLLTISTSITISSERKTQRDPSPIIADL